MAIPRNYLLLLWALVALLGTVSATSYGSGCKTSDFSKCKPYVKKYSYLSPTPWDPCCKYIKSESLDCICKASKLKYAGWLVDEGKVLGLVKKCDKKLPKGTPVTCTTTYPPPPPKKYPPPPPPPKKYPPPPPPPKKYPPPPPPPKKYPPAPTPPKKYPPPPPPPKKYPPPPPPPKQYPPPPPPPKQYPPPPPPPKQYPPPPPPPKQYPPPPYY